MNSFNQTNPKKFARSVSIIGVGCTPFMETLNDPETEGYTEGDLFGYAALSAMEDAGISLLVITPSSDLMYLTGYSKPATDRLTALLLTEHDSYFLCPAVEKNYLKEVDCQAKSEAKRS